MLPDDLEVTAYRGLYCRVCAADLDPDGFCPTCEVEDADWDGDDDGAA